MPLWAASYRLGRRVVRLLPPWLFRARPADVYEVVLADRQASAAGRDAAKHLPGADERIGWMESAEEAASLGALAARANKTAWDGDALRVAAVWQGDAPIACLWVARGAYEELDLRVHYELADDEAWLLAVVVAPEHRGRGVYRRLFEFVVAELLANGTRRALFTVAWGNDVSARIHERLGGRQIGRVVALRTLGFTLAVARGGVRRCGPFVSLKAARIEAD